MYASKFHSLKIRKKREALRRPAFSPLSRFPWKQGMSLLNLLMAIAIIAILTALLFTGVKSLAEASQAARCASNLRQLGAATRLYTAENNGYLPFYHTSTPPAGVVSFTYTGAWYWHLAPYLDIPRWESNKTSLGVQNGKIFRPNVFSCPAHGKDEIAMPLVFPTTRPVSYAPSGEISGSKSMTTISDGPDALVRGLRVQDIPSPAQKAWLSDSTIASSLNVSESRWTSDDDKLAWARVPFTRHNGAGNVLFFDGHVERVTYDSMVTGNIRENVLHLFRP